MKSSTVLGRFRRLYDNWIFGKRINALSYGAECYFARAHLIADDYGNFPVDPFILIAKAGGLRKVEGEEITDYIKEMERNGLIRLYLVDSSDWYGHIIAFTRSQPPMGGARGGPLSRKRWYPESPWDNDIPLSDQPRRTSSEGGPLPLSELSHKDNDKDKYKRLTDQEDRDRVKGLDRKDFVVEGFKYWQQTMKHPNASLSPERIDILQKRWQDSTFNELIQGIDGCESSDYHMGRQPNNPAKYDDLTLICRTRSKLEWFGDKVGTRRKGADDKKQRAEAARRRWTGNDE